MFLFSFESYQWFLLGYKSYQHVSHFFGGYELSLIHDVQNKDQYCKVEFNQPSYWFYSMPNLFVFQQLVTLYLGGFVVRVVSEIEWLNAQECARKQSLAGDSRLQAARCSTRAKHARRWTVMLAGALQDKIKQLAIQLSRDWISRLSQAASPSRKPPLFWKTWLFTFFSHPSINTSYTHKRMRASRENFERKTLE